MDPLEKFIVAIDFDGTIAKQEDDLVPRELLPNAKDVINWMHDNDVYIIIWTCRDDTDDIEKFMQLNDVKFDAVNENAPFLDFESSRKIFSNLYIDDRAYGVDRKINWLEIKDYVEKKLEEFNKKNKKEEPAEKKKNVEKKPEIVKEPEQMKKKVIVPDEDIIRFFIVRVR